MAKGNLEKITKLGNFFAGLFNKIVKESVMVHIKIMGYGDQIDEDELETSGGH
jgi:hypothetical protein